MNILTFPAHTRYFSDWSRTGHQFYIWHEILTGTGGDRSWDATICSRPENMIFCDNDPTKEYNLAVAHQVEQARLVREILPDLPIIGVAHGTMPKDEYNPYTCVVVATSEWNMRYCTHPHRLVIPVGVDPLLYSGYTGDIPCLITIAGRISSRPELRKNVTDTVVEDFQHIYIGAGNGSLANGLEHAPHDVVRGMMRHFRAMVYTPADDAGMGYSLCEALMTGMPVAISRFADWDKYIENGVSGCVSDDVAELRGFIRHCMASKPYAREVGARARSVAMEVLQLDRFVNMWTNLITQVGKGEYE